MEKAIIVSIYLVFLLFVSSDCFAAFGALYGLVLVEPSDFLASSVKISTSSGVGSIRKLHS